MPTPGLTLRKLADRSSGERVPRWDPLTGAKRLVNPATPGDEHEPWPLAGVQILDDPLPEEAGISTNMVAQGVHEGWIELVGERLVHRPGGPPGKPWRLTHTWTHAKAIVFKTVDGDVRYEVTRQPDKYVEDGADGDEVTSDVYEAGQTQVDMFYLLKLVRK